MLSHLRINKALIPWVKKGGLCYSATVNDLRSNRIKTTLQYLARCRRPLRIHVGVCFRCVAFVFGWLRPFLVARLNPTVSTHRPVISKINKFIRNVISQSNSRFPTSYRKKTRLSQNKPIRWNKGLPDWKMQEKVREIKLNDEIEIKTCKM